MKLTDNSVRDLRGILQKDLNRQISSEQTRKFGEWILKFYSHLAENKNGTSMNADGDRQLKTSTTNKNNK